MQVPLAGLARRTVPARPAREAARTEPRRTLGRAASPQGPSWKAGDTIYSVKSVLMAVQLYWCPIVEVALYSYIFRPCL